MCVRVCACLFVCMCVCTVCAWDVHASACVNMPLFFLDTQYTSSAVHSSSHKLWRRRGGCPPATKPPSTSFPAHPVLVRGNQIGVVSGVTGNYILSFKIVPIGIVTAASASIVHFTTGKDYGEPGSRSPAIWFNPGTSILAVYVTDGEGGNADSYALPLNVRTKVILELNGNDMKLTVGQSVYTSKQPYRRYAGNQIVYASDPWWPAANAQIYNLDYKILPAGLHALHDYRRIENNNGACNYACAIVVKMYVTA